MRSRPNKVRPTTRTPKVAASWALDILGLLYFSSSLRNQKPTEIMSTRAVPLVVSSGQRDFVGPLTGSGKLSTI